MAQSPVVKQTSARWCSMIEDALTAADTGYDLVLGQVEQAACTAAGGKVADLRAAAGPGVEIARGLPDATRQRPSSPPRR